MMIEIESLFIIFKSRFNLKLRKAPRPGGSSHESAT